MRKPDVTVAVLGAGPAGLIAARALATSGLDVVLVDGGTPPGRHFLESFPASGAPLAEDIGILALLCAASDGPAASMHLSWRDVPENRRYEGEGPLLVDRAAMHVALHQEAIRAGCRMMSARVRSVRTDLAGVEVTLDAGRLTANLVLDARGRVARHHSGDDLVALPFQAAAPVPPHRMFLEAQEDGWLWAASTANDTLHGAVFVPSRRLAGIAADDRHQLMAALVSEMSLVSEVRHQQAGRPVAAGFSAVADPLVTPRHILIGDAAIARDPIASHGVVHAMRSGVQSAIAARTILDEYGDGRAARAFLRHKHEQTVLAARLATDAAYTDQSLHDTAFWQERRRKEARPAPIAFTKEDLVSAQLTRAPVLHEDGIRWAPAISLPSKADFFISHGTVTAVDVAAATRPAASLETIAMRLARSHDIRCVAEVIDQLCAGGAFAQASVAA